MSTSSASRNQHGERRAARDMRQAGKSRQSRGEPERREAGEPREGSQGSGRRLHRAERRDQLLAAATRAFARAGFAATSLDDIAREAGISKVLLYRHFDSKADLYRDALDRACARLLARAGERDFRPDSVRDLMKAAAADPDGFRLLFQHAGREPEFRHEVDELRASMSVAAYRQLSEVIPDPTWAKWAAQLSPTVAIDAVTAWLDVGQPDLDAAAARILGVLSAIVQAAQSR